MYSVTFQSDNGKKFVFGVNGGNVFDMNLGNGLTATLSTSQGFSQVGETVQSSSVSGRSISVNGTLFRNVDTQKKTMRRIFTPYTSGKLVFDNKYYTRVFVKSSPSFSSIKNDGRFTMQFFAPYPFFFENSETVVELGTLQAMFHFPINYATPHKFGERTGTKYVNVLNDGDVLVPFSLTLRTTASESNNIVLTNLKSFQTLKINGTLNAGEVIQIYRDNDNILRATLTKNETEEDIISRIDESSDLFTLDVGDNLISVNDDEGGNSIIATVLFNPAVVALYES